MRKSGKEAAMHAEDQKLLKLYLSFEGPEAGPWNRSPQSLYLEYWTRSFIAQHLKPFQGIRVCNVGIGTGGWDNYLCDLLTGTGRLTSIDISHEICQMFEYRQKREGHPSPATVICADILADTMESRSFDVVTAIGSTATEARDYEGCLQSCWRLVRDRGHMMFMDFNRSPIAIIEKWIRSIDGRVADRDINGTVHAYAFWIERIL